MNDFERVQAYLQKASDDLAEAQLLLNANYTDGTCNRAYYCLFHCICALLFATNQAIPKTHTVVHQAAEFLFQVEAYLRQNKFTS